MTGTLTVDNIIERLRKREIATKNVDGAAFVKTFLNECADLSAEGYNINTSFFRSSISIQGVVYSEDLGSNIPAERVKVSVNQTQGDGARNAVNKSTVYIFEQAAPTGPALKTVRCPQEAEPRRLPLGGMVMIEGKRLAVKGDAEGLGVIFEKADGNGSPVVVPASALTPNQPSLLQFILPAAVTAGEWRKSLHAVQQQQHAAERTSHLGILPPCHGLRPCHRWWRRRRRRTGIKTPFSVSRER